MNRMYNQHHHHHHHQCVLHRRRGNSSNDKIDDHDERESLPKSTLPSTAPSTMATNRRENETLIRMKLYHLILTFLLVVMLMMMMINIVVFGQSYTNLMMMNLNMCDQYSQQSMGLTTIS